MFDLETRLLVLVREFGGKNVTLSSELYHDLHICMDDAGELLDTVHQKYGTSFEGFKFDTYFPIDGQGLPRLIKWLGVRDKKFASFTVAHLVAVVRQGRWFDPA